MYSSITTGAVHGIDSYLMQVETDISDGLPSFNMVGFVSSEVREAGERVRVALRNIGIYLPPKSPYAWVFSPAWAISTRIRPRMSWSPEKSGLMERSGRSKGSCPL